MADTWMALAGGKPPAQLGTYWSAGVGGRWSLLGSLRTRCLTILMDWLGRRGGLFLEWASAVFGDGERRGKWELHKDNSSSVDRSISSGTVASLPLLGREGGNGRGSSSDCSARPTSN